MRMGALFTGYLRCNSYFGHIPLPAAKVSCLCPSLRSLGCWFWICLSYWAMFYLGSDTWDRCQLLSWAEPFPHWLQTCSGAAWELSLFQPQDLFLPTSCAWAPFGHGSRQKHQNCALPTTGFSREPNSSAPQSHTTAVLHQPISSSLDFFMHRMCISVQ